jgi:hypothetical protein
MSDDVIFYTIPAEDIVDGMSTADGQDVLEVTETNSDGNVFVDVYTPADDPEEDEDNRCGPDCRIYPAGKLIEMATFENSEVDGSSYDRAVVVELCDECKVWVPEESSAFYGKHQPGCSRFQDLRRVYVITNSPGDGSSVGMMDWTVDPRDFRDLRVKYADLRLDGDGVKEQFVSVPVEFNHEEITDYLEGALDY